MIQTAACVVPFSMKPSTRDWEREFGPAPSLQMQTCTGMTSHGRRGNSQATRCAAARVHRISGWRSSTTRTSRRPSGATQTWCAVSLWPVHA